MKQPAFKWPKVPGLPKKALIFLSFFFQKFNFQHEYESFDVVQHAYRIPKHVQRLTTAYIVHRLQLQSLLVSTYNFGQRKKSLPSINGKISKDRKR